MNLETLKKIAICLVILYFGLKILSMLVPALLSVLGFVLKLAFWAMIIIVILYVIGYFVEKKK